MHAKLHERHTHQAGSKMQFEFCDTPNSEVQIRLPVSHPITCPQHKLALCHTAPSFSATPQHRLHQRQKHRQQRPFHQACFASLASALSNKKGNSTDKAAETADDEASAKLNKAAGWGKHLLCGALSAVVSRTTMAPLERIKLEIVLHKRQETMFDIAMGVLERDGKSGFWKGNGINLLRTAPYKVSVLKPPRLQHLSADCIAVHHFTSFACHTNCANTQRLSLSDVLTLLQAVNFFSFDMYRKALLRLTGNENKPNGAERFVAGALAGTDTASMCDLCSLTSCPSICSKKQLLLFTQQCNTPPLKLMAASVKHC